MEYVVEGGLLGAYFKYNRFHQGPQAAGGPGGAPERLGRKGGAQGEAPRSRAGATAGSTARPVLARARVEAQ